MKIRGDSCGKKFDPAKTDGICPHCGAWHSPPDDLSFSGTPSGEETAPWEEDFFEETAADAPAGDAPAPASAPVRPTAPKQPAAPTRPAAPNRPAAPAAPARRQGCLPLFAAGLIALALGLAVALVPPLLEQRIDAQAIAYNRPDPVITPAQGDTAVAAPFTYRLVDASFVDYDGPWPLPPGRRLLRVTLAVSMVGEEPDWDPQPPYLGLADGSWQLPMEDYDVRDALGDGVNPNDFPYGVYYLDTPSEELLCDFYYLVPEDTAAVTLCFERYSVSRYGEKLEEIVELPARVDPGEEAAQ